MRNAKRVLSYAAVAGALAAGMLAAPARAETYTVLAGAVRDASTGEKSALSGSLEAESFFVLGSQTAGPTWLFVTDFALEAGGETLAPALPPELDELEAPLLSRLGDIIQVEGESVGPAHLRAGGQPVDVGEDHVTFRYVELRGDTSGRAAGVPAHPSGAGLPRLLEVKGTLHEIRETYGVPREESCAGGPQRLIAGGAIEGEFAILNADTGTLFDGDLAGIAIDDVVFFGRITPPDPLPCGRLWPSSREEREIGPFSLIASTATPVEIDVKPWRARNRVRPASRARLAVALLGSDALDVRDVDPRSLRLGFGEAPAPVRRGLLRLVRLDVNRDGRADLLTRFDAREAGIAYGDSWLCLAAETRSGEPLEGCDAIETLPPRETLRSRLAAWLGRWSRPR